jgi:lipid A 3-O-deacylase
LSATGKLAWVLILGGILGFGAAPARARELTDIAVQAGHFSALRGTEQLEIGWEVRFAPREWRLFGRKRPWTPAAGIMVTGDGAQYYYAGGRFDVELNHGWRLTPSWALGLYNRDEGKDLGGVVEFRSAVEISRRLGRFGRLGAIFYHLSNAGLYRPNPGSESLLLTYSAGLH